ncbi:hypothetical protein QN277_008934 [Acacia crassicarpa]|uniref:Uncharacterized protein n=1 Tax=Acacia crassicarpa TaxID=499986 RepID=A0AAE1MB12_9FABA|nr:hypothetical protein QN277_008934 [Acacia crassicarpa]
MACSSSSSSSSIESVFEGFELCEASNVLLMTLMEEETQEDHYYQNCEEDERLVSMIQSLEAEINSRNPLLMMEQVDGQDCSTSLLSATDDDFDWVMEDMEIVPSLSSSPFDDLDAELSSCADMSEDYYSDLHQFYCGVSWVKSDA